MANPYIFLAQAGPGSSGLTTVLIFGGLFAVMYFLMIRPQQKQLQTHRALLASLKKGDDVVTQGGLIGKIFAVADKTVTLEIANNVRIKVLKTSVTARGTVPDQAAAEAPRGEEKKEER